MEPSFETKIKSKYIIKMHNAMQLKTCLVSKLTFSVGHTSDSNEFPASSFSSEEMVELILCGNQKIRERGFHRDFSTGKLKQLA